MERKMSIKAISIPEILSLFSPRISKRLNYPDLSDKHPGFYSG